MRHLHPKELAQDGGIIGGVAVGKWGDWYTAVGLGQDGRPFYLSRLAAVLFVAKTTGGVAGIIARTPITR